MLQAKIKNIINEFSCSKKVAVAVSGGADSMALLHCINNNVAKEVIPIIIDHGLRSESYDEALFVQQQIKNKINLNAIIIKNNDTNIASSIQEKARIIRYELIHQFCIQNKINELFVAQHLDDQIETYIIRKNAKSSKIGLACMGYTNYYKTLKIIRPFLQTYKFEIINYCKQNNIVWVEDPSNKNQSFQRVKIRENLPENKEKIIIKNKIFEYGKERKYIVQNYKNNFLSKIQFHHNSIAEIPHKVFLKFEYQNYAINHILNIFSNKYYQPRLKKIDLLVININNAINNNKQTKFVCHNCQIIITKDKIFIAQEEASINHNINKKYANIIENGNYFAKNLEKISFINKNEYIQIKSNNIEFFNNVKFPKQLIRIIPLALEDNIESLKIEKILTKSNNVIKNYNILFTEYIEFSNCL